MTPKLKAKELVFKFDDTMEFSTPQRFAKQCALIAVDEILKVCPYFDENIRENEEQLCAFDFQFVSYWQQVKQEIENL